MAYKGKYTVKNKGKYRGRIDNVTYRSLWELCVMKYLDANPNIEFWSSEETIIPYISEADGQRHRYNMDFTVKYKDGSMHLWEVKPYKQTQPPEKPKRLTVKSKERYMNEILTFQTNLSKWKAAKALSDKKGWKFKILTEHALKRYFGLKV